jgi:LPS export ABC transporter protein LptC
MRPILLIPLVLFATGCRSARTSPAERPTGTDSAPASPRSPDAVFHGGSRVDFWQSDTLAWRLNTDLLRQDPGSQRVWARPVDLTAYDKTRLPVAHVLADSGTMDRGMRFFRARGHVVGSNHGGMELRTDSLVFDKESDRIFTSAAVRVRTETGDVLTGTGFRSDAYLNRWEILSDVRGQIRDLGSLPFGAGK